MRQETPQASIAAVQHRLWLDCAAASCAMPEATSTTFAVKVRDLNRMGLSVAAIARSMGVGKAAVMAAHRMLYLPVNDTDAPSNVRTEAERAASAFNPLRHLQMKIPLIEDLGGP